MAPSPKTFLLFVSVFLSATLSAKTQSPTRAPIRVALFGDSTVKNYEGGSRENYGWGHWLPEALGPGYEVANYAKGARSSKSFWGYAAPALATHPDIVVVQFGHNDQPGKDPSRETDPATTYRDFLRKYIAAIRTSGAKPILVTPVVRRIYRPDGIHIDNTLRPYAEAMLAIGAEEDVPVYDLNAASVELFEMLGPEKSAAFNAAPTDFTHFNAGGAKQITDLVAGYLSKTIPGLVASPRP